MNNEAVAWAYIKDGEFWDAIHPDEHAQEEGSYTIPLYTHPVKELTLTDDEVMDLWNQASSHPSEFARAILRKAQATCNGFCGEYECKENQSNCKRKASEK